MILSNDSKSVTGNFYHPPFYVKICDLHEGNLHEQMIEYVQYTSRSEVFMENYSIFIEHNTWKTKAWKEAQY